MTNGLGATPQEWGHFNMVLGLGANMLPCVPAGPNVKVAYGSALEGKVGKIPSAFNGNGEAHGLKDWQKREILSNEIEAWSKFGVYNVCIRTGELSGVYAIDCDITDESTSDAVLDEVFKQLGVELPQRRRSNSPKFLIPFKVDGSWKKQIIQTEYGRIELLANGQQFVAAGTHSSGIRYEWPGGLPWVIPTLTSIQLQTLWSALQIRFSKQLFEKLSSIEDTSNSTLKDSDESASGILTTISEDEWRQLLHALRTLLPHVNDNDTWSEIGYALLSIKTTRPAQQLWVDFSRKSPSYTNSESDAPEKWWAAHEAQIPRSDYRHIFKLARARGWSATSDASTFVPVESSIVSDEDTMPPPVARPVVRIVGGELPAIADRCEKLLSPELYVHGRRLTKLGEGSQLADGVRRSNFQAVLMRAITAEWLRRRLTELATIQRYDVRLEDWKNIDCPKDLAIHLIDQPEWPQLRVLDSLAYAPFVREDGSICDTPGYDAQSNTIYVPNAEFPPIPQSPTRTDALSALDTLLGPFSEFPYHTRNSRTAFASHVLTEAARISIDRVPMFWYTAPEAGTGKTLLSEMPATIVHGVEPAVRPWPRTDEEIRKTLFASLLAGDRSIAFDNIPKSFKIRTPELCAFLTSAWWKDRKLGVSEALALRNRAVVSASGNNVTPVADMARRSLVIRLDANTPDLKARRFAIKNLRGYAIAHRVELLVAALTILRAFYIRDVTGESEESYPVPVPSFEQWSAKVRDPLLWLGMDDPAETQAEETDDEAESLAAAFEALGPTFNGHEFTAADVARLAATSDSLNNALLESGCAEPFSTVKVGYWLRDCRDRIALPWKLVAGKKDKHGMKWVFKQMTQNEDLA